MNRKSVALHRTRHSGSEPDAVMESAGSPTNRVPVPRSCHACHGKKIRCDKKTPCSSCTRTGKACVYPPTGPRLRRTKKAMMADLASRLSSIEKSLVKSGRSRSWVTELSTSKTTETTSYSVGSSTGTAASTNADRSSEAPRDHLLVEKGSTSEYFNEVLVSRVIEEDRVIGTALSTSQTASRHPPTQSPFNCLGILSAVSFSQIPSSFHPPKPLAVRLWSIYVNNVEGCADLKILHIPTDEVKIYSVINDPASAAPEDLALCFAVYFASAVSVDDSAVVVTLGQDRNMLLQSFKSGLEQSFAHGNFLDRPTVPGLQALAIYLSILRVQNRGKGIWILNGLAMRIAHSMGLHRDGKRLGLSPFQAERRRRLWWYLITRDKRAGEDYGLENTTVLSLKSDVDIPLNVDDTELRPDMSVLPVENAGWTPMTFSIINIEIALGIQKLADVAAASSPWVPPSEKTRERIIGELKSLVQKRLENANPIIPQHRMTMLCSTFLLRKITFITKVQWAVLRHPSRDGTQQVGFATEENLAEALEILEPRLYTEDELLKQYVWLSRAYPQYHVMTYVLWHLCVKPDGPNVERAWQAVEVFFTEDLGGPGTLGHGSRAAVLTALRTKAESARKGLDRGIDTESSEEGAGGGVQGNLPVVTPPGGGLSAYLLADMVGEAGGFMDGWTDWVDVGQVGRSDSHDVFWQWMQP